MCCLQLRKWKFSDSSKFGFMFPFCHLLTSIFLLSLITTLSSQLKPLYSRTCRALDFKNTTQVQFEGNVWLLLQSISWFPGYIHSESMGPWWIVSLMLQMRLPLNMQATQSHLQSLGQANLIMNAVMIGSYTWVADHSCSFLNQGYKSGFNIWWLFEFLYGF